MRVVSIGESEWKEAGKRGLKEDVKPTFSPQSLQRNPTWKPKNSPRRAFLRFFLDPSLDFLFGVLSTIHHLNFPIDSPEFLYLALQIDWKVARGLFWRPVASVSLVLPQPRGRTCSSRFVREQVVVDCIDGITVETASKTSRVGWAVALKTCLHNKMIYPPPPRLLA